MFIVHVYAEVKQPDIEAFVKATIENAARSMEEPGVARFDVLQQSVEPPRFVLCEVYHSERDALLHKETRHYQKWRDTVAPMMARPRESTKYMNVFPDDGGWMQAEHDRR